nr:PASTA domain-containing protein [Gemmatimonadota bacterium]
MNEVRARIWAVGMASLLLATVGAFALGREAAEFALLPATLTRERAQSVPNLVGRPLKDARERAAEVGSAVDVLGLAYDADVDSGEVVVQYPPEGLALEPGKPIEVLIGAGAGRRRAPDLDGLPLQSALAVLKAAGVPLARVRYVAAGREEGSVLATRPAAGAVLGDADSVVVEVSRGGVVVEVPDVVGRTRGEAVSILRAAQLRFRIVDLEGSAAVGTPSSAGEDSAGAAEIPGNRVVSQDPPPGGLARTGTPVVLRLGAGNPRRVLGQVPDERPLDDARTPDNVQR